MEIQVEENRKLIESASILANRLERLSADSIWAHRSSGLRGSLLKFLEEIELQMNENLHLTETQITRLKSLMTRGYFMLENAAREIPVKE